MARKSPLAPARFPHLAPIAGVRLAAGTFGLRYKGRADLMLAELAPGTTIAGVLTRSATAAAPVDWCRQALKRGRARLIVVNAGNANAFTGKAGIAAVERTAARGARLFDCPANQVFVSSTGVIGEPLDDGKIRRAMATLKRRLAPGMSSPTAG